MTSADRLWNEIMADMMEQKINSMTDEEFQAELDAGDPVPMSAERIQEIVDYAVGRTGRCYDCHETIPGDREFCTDCAHMHAGRI